MKYKLLLGLGLLIAVGLPKQAIATTCTDNLMGLGMAAGLATQVCALAPDSISVVGDASIGGDYYLTGRPVEIMTVTDNDAQSNTLSVAEWAGGLTVHTSVTGAGTVTTDTATNLVAGSGGVGTLTANNQCVTHYYVNDGTQTLTFAGGTGVTVSDAGQTLAANESAILVFCRASATTGTLHIFGG